MSQVPFLLLLDNYDSFTHNLAQCLLMLGQTVRVVRNDEISPAQVVKLAPGRVVISPGPGGPDSAGVSVPLIRRLAGRVPLLGVCLGHQCLAHAFGGEITRAERVIHGKTSAVNHDGQGLHRGLPDPFQATRYHSLIVREESLPARFRVTARAADDGAVMAIADERAAMYGVQYHPESFMTFAGLDVLRNFLESPIPGQTGPGKEATTC
jgi:anthranilate synthase/aminodeoxychorismate synthase-like glutamine amidotransferase